METSWNDINEPVGNTLQTGGPPRYQDETFSYEAGSRKKTTHGGEFEIGQQFGYQRSNSVFFVPNDQGTSRLTMNFTQPLLRGAGRMFNTSTVLLAQIQSGMARDEFSRELQSHLLDIAQSYWTLYLERGTLLQRQRLFKRGQLILEDLEVREELDAVTNQIVRARAAVASRRSDLFRAATAVKNAEARIRALVNAPDLGLVDEYELMPIEAPANDLVPVSMPDALQAAVRNRPEVQESMKQIKASAVRLDVSKNELLPVLDLVVETYVMGLRGKSDIGGALSDQYQDGSPSYSAGLRFEVPYRNRAARARFQRRALELRQFQQQFRNTLQALQLEVEIAVRETITTFREIDAKYQAMEAAEGEVEFLTQRWTLLPNDDRSASLLLEDLLAAQERLAIQEHEYLNSQLQYNIAVVHLKRATGTLLQFENISVNKLENQGIPSLQLHKTQAMAHGPPMQPIEGGTYGPPRSWPAHP